MKSIEDVKLIDLACHKNQGVLVPIEAEKDIPFLIRRVFFVNGVPKGEVRGKHAHKKCNQVFVCQQGVLNVRVDDGVNRREFTLRQPNTALVVPQSIWAEEVYSTSDAALLVLTDMLYDSEDYIRTYAEFLEWRGLK